MADNHTGALATAVAFLGALGAAIKLWPKNTGERPENHEVRMLMERVEKLETAVILLTEQQRRAELDREEANVIRGQIFSEIRQTRESIARIEGRLAG